MAMTDAERQKKYRKARPEAGENGERLINTYVTTAVSLGLARLARHHGITRRAVLEQLVTKADDAILSKIDLDTPEWDAYMVSPTRTRRKPKRKEGQQGGSVTT